MLTIRFVRDLIKAVQNFLRHDGLVMAGHLAFLSVLGLFPFLIILVALAGLFGNTAVGAQAIVIFLETLPPEIQIVVEGPVTQIVASGQKGALTLGLVGALWAASSAIEAARMAIDRAYEAGHPPAFWLRRLQGIGLVIAGAVTMLLGLSSFILGPLIWDGLLFFIPNLDRWTLAATLIRFGTSTALMYLAVLALFFGLKPRYRGRFAPIGQGAFLTLILWLGIGSGFSIYLKNFANYDLTYGSLAGAIATLMFFYLLNMAFVLGAELNAVVADRKYRAREAAAKAKAHKKQMQQASADTRPSD